MSKNGKTPTVVLDRAAMLERPRLRELVELGQGSVWVQALGGRDLRDAQKTLRGMDVTAQEGVDATLTIVIATAVDSHGYRLFTEADREVITDLPIADLTAISTAAFRLSGFEVLDENGALQAGAPNDRLRGALPADPLAV